MSEEIKIDETEPKLETIIEDGSTSQKEVKKQIFLVQHQKLVVDVDIQNKALVGYTDIQVKCLENLNSIHFHCNSQIRKKKIELKFKIFLVLVSSKKIFPQN